MKLLLRHKLLIGVVTLVAAGSAGAAYAATQSSSNPRQAFLNDVASRLHVSPSQLSAAFKAALIDRLNAAVKAGQLTQAQANRIERRLEQRGGPPLLFGRGGRLHLHARAAMLGPGTLGAAANYLGLREVQLLNDLRAGKSMAQVATAQGKSLAGLEQAIISSDKARLDRLVASGLITKAQEQRILNALSARVGRLVNRTRFPRLGVAGPAPWLVPQTPVPQNGPMVVPPNGPIAVPPIGPAPAPGPAD